MLSTQQIILMAAQVVGGLALFLYGMNVLSSYLTQFSGGRLESMIGKATGNRYVSWLFGTGVTSIVQSSSATTVMTVGLVNSGIMKLEQTVGLILGANLGTTATANLAALGAGTQARRAALAHLLFNGDQYMVIADFRSYADAQDRLYKAISDPSEMGRLSLINTAQSGFFAADRAIREYAKDIWHIS